MRRALIRALILGLLVSIVGIAFGSTAPRKRSKSDRDLNAIGHRALFKQKENLYSPQQEAKIGEQIAASLEQNIALLQSEPVLNYVDRVGQHVAQNSDAKTPIHFKIIHSADVIPITLQGGYVYLPDGLLRQLQSEGELASVLARAVAHVALHSAARELTYKSLLHLTAIPQIQQGTTPALGIGPDLYTVSWHQDDELDADYFGIQYLYKSGYDSDCFLKAIQRTAPQDSPTKVSASLNALPPLSTRIDALQKEISEILPRRPGEIVSTPEFDEFLEKLQQVPPADPGNRGLPQLTRQDRPAQD